MKTVFKSILILCFVTNISFVKSQEPIERSWFDEAKFGIMVHWGLYTVPAYAPNIRGAAPEDWVEYFLEVFLETLDLQYAAHRMMATSPYAEWYFNSMQFPYETGEYHDENFGSNFEYSDFEPLFEDSAQTADPAEWAEYFAEVGAKYVVFVTKHHDGYQLWPSDVANIYYPEYYSNRDFVGELGEAVRENGMIYGLYYSGGIDVTFKQNRINFYNDYLPPGGSYGAYCKNQMKELIDNYKPAVLWNDIGYPFNGDAAGLERYYKEKVPYGWINDRFLGLIPGDFNTPEYANYDSPRPKKWESVRGISESFGYNRFEPDSLILSPFELKESFTSIISNGGNLLLNIPITASGVIEGQYRTVLDDFSNWLKINKEGVFKSTYRVEGTSTNTMQGDKIYFTKREDTYYLFFRDSIEVNNEITVLNFNVEEENTPLSILGIPLSNVEWYNDGENLVVNISDVSNLSYPIVLRVGEEVIDNQVVGVIENDNTNIGLNVYPNPVKDILHFKLEHKNIELSTIRIYNVLGKKILSRPFTEQLNVSSLSKNIYFIEFLNNRQEVISSIKFIKD